MVAQLLSSREQSPFHKVLQTAIISLAFFNFLVFSALSFHALIYSPPCVKHVPSFGLFSRGGASVHPARKLLSRVYGSLAGWKGNLICAAVIKEWRTVDSGSAL